MKHHELLLASTDSKAVILFSTKKNLLFILILNNKGIRCLKTARHIAIRLDHYIRRVYHVKQAVLKAKCSRK